jgi:putative membrane protein
VRKPSWRSEGEEPDYRFTLANERTFLAWIRTALALLAGGVLLDQFSTRLEPHVAVLALAIALSSLAALLSLLAYTRWRANQIAMRHAGPLPATMAIPLLAWVSLAVAAIVASMLLAR